MWADAEEPFRPVKSSWSPWWIAAAVLFGIGIGVHLAGGSVASLLTQHLRQEKTTAHQAPGRFQDERSRGATRVAAPLAPRETSARAQPYVSSAHPEAEPPSATREVFLCKTYVGGMFWSSATCSTQRATIDRIVTVPGHLSWGEAVEAGERQRRAVESLYLPPKVATTAGGITHAAARSSSTDCTGLKAQIEHLDAVARQPQSAQSQDRLRRERQRIRDREAALHC